MKKYLLLAVSLVLAGAVSFAQDQTRDRDRIQDPTQDKIQKRDRIHTEDHLYYKDGKLYQVKNGVRTELKEQVQLRNGTLVNPDGTCQLREQQRWQLRDGQCLDMQGNHYKNQNRFNKQKMMTQRELQRVQTRSLNQAQKQNRTGDPGRSRSGGNGGNGRG